MGKPRVPAHRRHKASKRRKDQYEVHACRTQRRSDMAHWDQNDDILLRYNKITPEYRVYNCDPCDDTINPETTRARRMARRQDPHKFMGHTRQTLFYWTREKQYGSDWCDILF